MTTNSTPNTPLTAEIAELEAVEFDVYRDIHKGIRLELFGVTQSAGSVDPGDRDALEAEGERLRRLVYVLISHAEHEDEFVQPVIEQHAPKLAEVIRVEHVALEAQMARLELLSDRTIEAIATERRRLSHRLYLALASFTSDYLRHQAFEELEVGPALARAIGTEALLAIDHQIVASIPPEDMALGLSLMVPAMNIDDRTDWLGGVKQGAPPEVFEGVRSIVAGMLAPSDYDALAARIEAA